MATVTEPPWVRKASGVAPRNGTSSHTISFGASASGSLLIVVVFGAVTMTVTGWTKRLTEVGSGEIAVFTKVSAGDNSITVAHNGSDYAVGWLLYELPAGSAWVGSGASHTASTYSFPTLSGLPGVDTVVFAALGQGHYLSGTNSVDATWSSPWVEDLDLFSPYETTDGFFFTAGHQINVKAISITPSATIVDSGVGFAPDREAVTFACNVAAASSAIDLVVAGASQAQAAGNVALNQAHNLTAAGATQGQASGTLTLAQAHSLAADSVAQAQTSSTPTLTQVHSLDVQDAVQLQASDTVPLSQAADLAVADAFQLSVANNVTLTQVHTLEIAPVTQPQSASNVTLTQAHRLLVADARMAQAASNLRLITLTDLELVAVIASDGPVTGSLGSDGPVVAVAPRASGI